jgi:hypothetical protein
MMRFRGISQVTVTEWICGLLLRRRHARDAVRFVIETPLMADSGEFFAAAQLISMPGGIKPVVEKGTAIPAWRRMRVGAFSG